MTNPPASYARTAGILYLVIAVFGAFSIGYVPLVIIVAGDAAQTAQNLLANPGLFSLGVLGDVVVLLTEIILTAMLYVLFKPVSPTLSLVAALARIAMVLVMGVNLLINILPMLLLSNTSYLSGFDNVSTQAAILFLFDVHAYGIFVWQLFFALHLVALGYMVVKSGITPKILGWMMLIGSMGYFLQGLAKVTFYEGAPLNIIVIGLLVIVTIGELAFALWLVVKGVKPVV